MYNAHSALFDAEGNIVNRLLLTVALTLITALLLPGCSKPAHSLIGTWSLEVPSEQDPPSATITFSKDGTVTNAMSADGQSMVMKAKYTSQGQFILTTPVSMTTNGQTKLASLVERSPIQSTFSIGGDRLTIKTGSKSMVYDWTKQ